jgi:VanZ family protein
MLTEASIPDKRTRIATWAAIVYSVLLALGSLIPGEGVPTFSLLGWDKLAHAVAFLVLGLLSMAAMDGHERGTALIAVWGLSMSIVTELLQWPIPGRSTSVFDGVADMVGIGLAILLYTLISRRRRAQSSMNDDDNALAQVAEQMLRPSVKTRQVDSEKLTG